MTSNTVERLCLYKLFNLCTDDRRMIDTEQGYAYGTKANLGGYRVSAMMTSDFPTNDGTVEYPGIVCVSLKLSVRCLSTSENGFKHEKSYPQPILPTCSRYRVHRPADEKYSASGMKPHVSLVHQISHFALQLLDSVFGAFDGCSEPAPILSPAANAVKLLSAATFLGLEFVAVPAATFDLNR